MKRTTDTRPVGLTRDAGWEVGVRRTFRRPVEQVWQTLLSPAGLRAWLGDIPELPPPGQPYATADGVAGEVRSLRHHDRVRLTWQPSSRDRAAVLQIAVTPAPTGTAVTLHQERLADAREREQRRAALQAALDRVGDLLAAAAETRGPLLPVWADLGTPDPDAAAAFYEAALGWSVAPVADPAAGGYRLCTVDGALVAGIGPMTAGLQDRSWWDVHLGTADLDDALAAVRGGGATVLAGPIDVLGLGRLAVCSDPTGAQFRLLEGLAADRFAGHGALTWVERIDSRDDAASGFASRVLGWASGTGRVGTSVRRPTAAERHVHWIPYFGAEDLDGAVTRAVERGGRLVADARLPIGDAAVLADPTGAVFGLCAITTRGDAAAGPAGPVSDRSEPAG